MANPFPGMGPWMEEQWGDAHHRLITYAAEQMRGVLPRDLKARIEERVFVESDAGSDRTRFPEVRVFERTRVLPPRPVSNTTGVAMADPLVIKIAAEPMSQGYIQIIDARSGGRVVTVVEVLSPSNKVPGAGRQLYLGKQAECQTGAVNLVEIDLLRGGAWTVAVPHDRVPATHDHPYRACVWRASEPAAFEFYAIALREKLPAIRLPLRPGDPDVPLDLQPLLDRVHEAGGYDDTDYARPPVPPLSAEDAAWAAQLLLDKSQNP